MGTTPTNVVPSEEVSVGQGWRLSEPNSRLHQKEDLRTKTDGSRATEGRALHLSKVDGAAESKAPADRRDHLKKSIAISP